MVQYEYGINPKNVVLHINEATKNVLYTCVGCDAPLIRKRGEKKAKHFAHKSEATNDGGTTGCTGESYEHKLAKRLIKEHIEKWTTNVYCKTRDCRNLIKEAKIGQGSSVKLEKRFEGVNYVPDVTVEKSDGERVIFEVFHTHSIGGAKRDFFIGELGVNCVYEVAAKSVIESKERGDFQLSCEGDTFCPRCKKSRERDCYDCKKRFDVEDVHGGGRIVGTVNIVNLYYVCDECVTTCGECGGKRGKKAVCRVCIDKKELQRELKNEHKYYCKKEAERQKKEIEKELLYWKEQYEQERQQKEQTAEWERKHKEEYEERQRLYNEQQKKYAIQEQQKELARKEALKIQEEHKARHLEELKKQAELEEQHHAERVKIILERDRRISKEMELSIARINRAERSLEEKNQKKQRLSKQVALSEE